MKMMTENLFLAAYNGIIRFIVGITITPTTINITIAIVVGLITVRILIPVTSTTTTSRRRRDIHQTMKERKIQELCNVLDSSSNELTKKRFVKTKIKWINALCCFDSVLEEEEDLNNNHYKYDSYNNWIVLFLGGCLCFRYRICKDLQTLSNFNQYIVNEINETINNNSSSSDAKKSSSPLSSAANNNVNEGNNSNINNNNLLIRWQDLLKWSVHCTSRITNVEPCKILLASTATMSTTTTIVCKILECIIDYLLVLQFQIIPKQVMNLLIEYTILIIVVQSNSSSSKTDDESLLPDLLLPIIYEYLQILNIITILESTTTTSDIPIMLHINLYNNCKKEEGICLDEYTFVHKFVARTSNKFSSTKHENDEQEDTVKTIFLNKVECIINQIEMISKKEFNIDIDDNDVAVTDEGYYWCYYLPRICLFVFQNLNWASRLLLLLGPQQYIRNVKRQQKRVLLAATKTTTKNEILFHENFQVVGSTHTTPDKVSSRLYCIQHWLNDIHLIQEVAKHNNQNHLTLKDNKPQSIHRLIQQALVGIAKYLLEYETMTKLCDVFTTTNNNHQNSNDVLSIPRTSIDTIIDDSHAFYLIASSLLNHLLNDDDNEADILSEYTLSNIGYVFECLDYSEVLLMDSLVNHSIPMIRNILYYLGIVYHSGRKDLVLGHNYLKAYTKLQKKTSLETSPSNTIISTLKTVLQRDLKRTLYISFYQSYNPSLLWEDTSLQISEKIKEMDGIKYCTDKLLLQFRRLIQICDRLCTIRDNKLDAINRLTSSNNNAENYPLSSSAMNYSDLKSLPDYCTCIATEQHTEDLQTISSLVTKLVSEVRQIKPIK